MIFGMRTTKQNITRKSEHIKTSLQESESYNNSGFENIILKHRALPEIDFEEVSLEKIFLKKKLNFPIIIEAISGGTKEGKFINVILSKIADEYRIGFMVGSERVLIENSKLKETFKIYGKPPLIIANIGAVQLNNGVGIKECKKIIEAINADAIAFHLNPLQECFQLNGDKNFKNLKEKIRKISMELRNDGIKVIVKEVGNGLSYEDVNNLNVDAIDVAGKGGTNWAVIEGKINKSDIVFECSKNFYDWGISTIESLIEIVKIKEKENVSIIASGGIRNGIQAAKSFAMGADVVGMAMPFLREIYKNKGNGEFEMNDEETAMKNLRKFLDKFILELKIALFLTGSKNVEEIKGKYYIKGHYF